MGVGSPQGSSVSRDKRQFGSADVYCGSHILTRAGGGGLETGGIGASFKPENPINPQTAQEYTLTQSAPIHLGNSWSIHPPPGAR